MFQNNARRNRRQFQPAIEGLSLRIAPSTFAPTGFGDSSTSTTQASMPESDAGTMPGFGDSCMDEVSMPTCGPEDMVERNSPVMVVDLGVSMPVM